MDIFKRKRLLLARICGILSSTNYDFYHFLQSLEANLLHEYQDVLYQGELLSYQKSRMMWILDGETNTKYCHLSTIVRRNFNQVAGLKIMAFGAAKLKQVAMGVFY